MDELPPELHPRRQEIHNRVRRRAQALRHRRAAAMIAVIAMLVAIPTAAIALNAAGSSHGGTTVAVSGDPTTEATTTGSTDAIEATTTSLSPTVNSTASTTVSQPAATSSTSLVCHNSMNPACGPLRYEPSITDQPATLTVKVSPNAPKVGEMVTFTFHATDPDSRISPPDVWCNNGGYSFGDGSDGTMCETACAAVPGYGPWDPPLGQASDVTATLTHAHEKVGTFRATFGMTAEPCGPRPSMTSTAIAVTVTTTPPTSQSGHAISGP
jgi:hypothetical protein